MNFSRRVQSTNDRNKTDVSILSALQFLAAKREITMILVTHHMNFAERCADRVLFIDQGQIIEDGEATRIFRQPCHDRTRHFLDALIEHHG